MKGNSGISRLLQLNVRTVREHAPREQWLGFGTVLAGGALQVDGYQVPFPAGTWYVLEYLTGEDPMAITGGSLPRLEILSPLEAGDRVLVAIVNGVDPVVLGRVSRASRG